MEINNNMRLERFDKGSVIQQNLYASPEAGAAMRTIANRYNIPESAYLDFVTVFGDIVLGFYPITSLEKNLRDSPNLSEFITLPLISEIQKLLKPLIDTQENLPAVNTSVNIDVQTTPLSPEKIIINPLRTMASDGKEVGYQSTEEPVYTSVQNAIINESKWGSDDGK